MGELDVRHLGGDRFAIDVRGHKILVDQPTVDGGEDTAPTPTELLVASLASCVAFYANRFLARHGIAADGLTVHADYAMAARPPRVADITVSVDAPPGLSDARRGALHAVVSHCTVHNTLVNGPQVRIAVTDPAANR